MRLGSPLLAALALTVAMAAPAAAAPILVGNTITFNLLDTGFGDYTDTKVIAAAGAGINEGDTSNIGGVMLTGEFIHVFNTSIEFSLFGGDATNVVQSGPPQYLGTGYAPSARYVLTGLFDPLAAEITGVTVTLFDVVGVSVAGGQVAFDAHSVTLFIDTLGIRESPSNLGRVTLDFTTRDLNGGPGPTPVPEPATLTLLGSGVAAAWIRRRRSQTRLS